MEADGRLVLLHHTPRHFFDDWRYVWRRGGHYQIIQGDGRVAALVMRRQLEFCLKRAYIYPVAIISIPYVLYKLETLDCIILFVCANVSAHYSVVISLFALRIRLLFLNARLVESIQMY